MRRDPPALGVGLSCASDEPALWEAVSGHLDYVEITPDRHQSLWEEYQKLQTTHKQFAMQEIGGAEDIYPVFRELFKRRMA